jgi:hypothetical protein
METIGPACLPCVGLDDLEYLPAGDALLTRRAKATTKYVVVVRFSRGRRRLRSSNFEDPMPTHGAGILLCRACRRYFGVPMSVLIAVPTAASTADVRGLSSQNGHRSWLRPSFLGARDAANSTPTADSAWTNRTAMMK